MTDYIDNFDERGEWNGMSDREVYSQIVGKFGHNISLLPDRELREVMRNRRYTVAYRNEARRELVRRGAPTTVGPAVKPPKPRPWWKRAQWRQVLEPIAVGGVLTFFGGYAMAGGDTLSGALAILVGLAGALLCPRLWNGDPFLDEK